jgi:hypothetical protein
MSSTKRKWDEAGPQSENGEDTPTKAVKAEDGKTASEAAAAAAAIAAKIAAQYAAGGIPSGSGLRDPHDAEFTYDIDINDVRNRYMLTKGTTQQDVSFHVILSIRPGILTRSPQRFTRRPVLPSAQKEFGTPTGPRQPTRTLLSTSTSPLPRRIFCRRVLTRSTTCYRRTSVRSSMTEGAVTASVYVYQLCSSRHLV